jgi:hypothetical protein
MRVLRAIADIALGLLICPLVTLSYLEIRWRTRKLRAPAHDVLSLPKMEHAGELAPLSTSVPDSPAAPYIATRQESK